MLVAWRGSEKGGREEGVRIMGETREEKWMDGGKGK